MNDLQLKKFAEDNNLSREDIAKILDSSIHTVNSWFSGSRNIPLSKQRILESYNVPVQSKDLALRIELLENTVEMLKEQLKMQQDTILFLQNIFVNKNIKTKSS